MFFILTLLPILDQIHKGWMLQTAKVPLQISFKHSESFWHFLWISDQKLSTWNNNFCFVLKENLMLEKRKIRRRINVLYWWLHGYIQPDNLSSALSHLLRNEFSRGRFLSDWLDWWTSIAKQFTLTIPFLLQSAICTKDLPETEVFGQAKTLLVT